MINFMKKEMDKMFFNDSVMIIKLRAYKTL